MRQQTLFTEPLALAPVEPFGIGELVHAVEFRPVYANTVALAERFGLTVSDPFRDKSLLPFFVTAIAALRTIGARLDVPVTLPDVEFDTALTAELINAFCETTWRCATAYNTALGDSSNGRTS